MLRAIGEALAADNVIGLLWKDRVREDMEFSMSTFKAAECPRFLDAYASFIELHGFHHVDPHIVAVALVSNASLLELRDEASGFLAHFTIRDEQHQKYMYDLAHPVPETIYWATDQKERAGLVSKILRIPWFLMHNIELPAGRTL